MGLSLSEFNPPFGVVLDNYMGTLVWYQSLVSWYWIVAWLFWTFNWGTNRKFTWCSGSSVKDHEHKIGFQYDIVRWISNWERLV